MRISTSFIAASFLEQLLAPLVPGYIFEDDYWDDNYIQRKIVHVVATDLQLNDFAVVIAQIIF